MRWALAAAAATGVQVGAALVASGAVVAEVGAGRLGVLRYAIALVILVPLALAAKGPPVARRDLLPVCLLGIGQFGVLIALLNLAVMWTDPARAALIFATLPLMTVAVGRALGRAALGRRETLAIGLTLAGIAALLGADAFSGGLKTGDVTGMAAAALATLTGAICANLYRPWIERYGVVRVSAIAMAAALLPLGLLGAVEAPASAAWPPATWGAIVFVGVSSGVGYLLWLFALARLEAAIVTAFLALSPVTAALGGLALGQPPGPGLIPALALVAAGLALMATPASALASTAPVAQVSRPREDQS